MHSTKPSLVRRVGWTAAICALIASIATLAVAMLVIDREAIADAKVDVLDRARVFISELESEGEFGDDQKHVEDEISEFTHGGIAIAVDRDGRELGGSQELPDFLGEGCAFRERSNVTWLVCSVTGPLGYRVRMGEPKSLLLAHRKPLLLGGLVALFFLVLLSVVAGLIVARWSMAPLTRLCAALGVLQPESGETVAALPKSGLVEVDLVATALDDLVSRLQREISRSRNFAADAAHELRSPLAKVRAELELLAEEKTPSGPEATRLKSVVDHVASLGLLVEQLLVLASPHESIRSTTLVSLAVTVETVVEQLEQGDRSRVIVALEDDGMVIGDATILSSVVSNALSNALKYSEGPVHAKVSMEDGTILFRVDDRGPGMDSSQRTSVFQQFFRAPEHRGTPGHGIGLALIAHIVEAHQGTVAFVDEAPGAHLEIRLPGHPLS